MRDIYAGKIEALDEAVPGFAGYDTQGRAVFRPKGFLPKIKALYIRYYRQRGQRWVLNVHISHVTRRMLEPANLRGLMNTGTTREIDNPRMTWYAYFADKFMSEYAMPLETFDVLPYASINEYMIAMSVRAANNSARATSENHADREAIRELAKYLKRDVNIPDEVRAAEWMYEMDHNRMLPFANSRKLAEEQRAKAH